MNVREFVKTLRTGTLSVEEIGRGMHKSFVNAVALIEDAELLLEKRPERSISLAVLAIEEIAKVVLLADGAVRAANAPVEWGEIQEDLQLRSHQSKQTIFAAYGRSVLDACASVGGKPTYYEHLVPGGIAPLLDLFKQLGFYVDAGHGQFTSPQEFGAANREWADWLIAVATERIKSFEPLHGTEGKSIEFAWRAAEFARVVADSKSETEFRERIERFVEERQART